MLPRLSASDGKLAVFVERIPFKGSQMPNLADTEREMQVVGYRFEMRSSQEYSVGEEFIWGGLTLRVTSKKPDDGHFIRNWPWPFMYGFEVIATEEMQGKRRGSI